jgi:RNA polymerase-binding transcription factor DksA
MTDLTETKARLQTRLQELTERAETIDNDLSEPANDDWGEEAIESEGVEVLEEIGEVTLEEISQIKRALSRIDAGKYGECIKCGGPISQERLKALPHATNCVKCA